MCDYCVMCDDFVSSKISLMTSNLEGIAINCCVPFKATVFQETVNISKLFTIHDIDGICINPESSAKSGNISLVNKTMLIIVWFVS